MPSRVTARAIRVAAGVTQARLAAELGVHAITVNRWETGRRTPSGDLARRYVQLLEQLREVAL